MEHVRPTGLSDGYYCPNCGGVCGMMGHFNLTTNDYKCERNQALVNILEELNR